MGIADFLILAAVALALFCALWCIKKGKCGSCHGDCQNCGKKNPDGSKHKRTFENAFTLASESVFCKKRKPLANDCRKASSKSKIGILFGNSFFQGFLEISFYFMIPLIPVPFAPLLPVRK